MKAKHLLSLALSVIALFATHVTHAINWEFISPYPTERDLNSVAYGAGVFVAVGDGITLYSQDNGANWHRGAGHDTNEKYVGVAYGNNTFVAVSAGSGVLTSADGKTWNRTAPPGFSGATEFAFGNGVFVAPSRDNKIAVSANGLDWTFTTVNLNPESIHLAFGNGKFLIAQGERVVLLSSTNGLDWEAIFPSGLNNWRGSLDLTFGNGSFALMIAIGPIGTRTYISQDGLNFQARTSPGALIGLNEGFFFPGWSWSSDLITWNPITPVGPNPVPATSGASGGGYNVVVGRFGLVLRGPNLASWQRVDSPDRTAFLTGVAASGSTIVASHQQTWEPSRLLVSTNNGRIFQPVPLPDTSGPLTAIAHADGRFVATGLEGTIIRSSDGLTWSKRLSNTSSDLHHLAHGAGLWVAVGANGKIVSSPDSSIFVLRTSGTEVRLNAITFGSGKFVVVGQNGIILTSPNAIDWSMTGTDEAIDLYSIAYGNGRFVAGGTNGIVHTWLDGAARQTTTLPGGGAISVAFHHGQFIALDLNTRQMFTSFDGLSWTPTAGPEGFMLGINVSDNRLWAFGNFSLIWKAAAPTLSLAGSIVSGKFQAQISVPAPGNYRVYQATDPTGTMWRVRDLLNITDSAPWVDNEPVQAASFYILKREP